MKLFKSLTALLLSLTLLLSVLPSVGALDYPMPGDLDEDGLQTVADIILIKNIVMETPTIRRIQKIADMDGSGKVDVSDILVLKNDIMSELPTKRHPRIAISDGAVFYVENLRTGRFVYEGTRGRTYECAFTGTAPLQWKAVQVEDDYFMIVSLYNDRVWTMEPRGDTMWLYVRDIEDMNAPTDLQLFKFLQDAEGQYRIYPKSGEGGVIELETNPADAELRLLQGADDYSGTEEWALIAADEDYTDVLAEGFADQVYTAFMDNFYLENPGGGYIIKDYNYFWDWAEMIEMVIDAYEANPTEENKQMIHECYDGFVDKFGTNWFWNAYNDDIMWMVIACCRAYNATGDEKYKEQAMIHFDHVIDVSYDDAFGGGIYWKSDNNDTKNSCINCPAIIAASYLHEMYPEKGYLELAEDLFQWQIDTLVVPDGDDAGRVNDNIHWEGENAVVNWNDFTYNQGTFIGAATRLYELTEEQSYLDYAKLTADYTAFRKYDGGVINNEGSATRDYDDSFGFKGIFMRWLGYYINNHDVDDYDDWLLLNLETGWSNRNSNGLVCTLWGTKTPEAQVKAFSYYNYVVLAQIAPYERLRSAEAE